MRNSRPFPLIVRGWGGSTIRAGAETIIVWRSTHAELVRMRTRSSTLDKSCIPQEHVTSQRQSGCGRKGQRSGVRGQLLAARGYLEHVVPGDAIVRNYYDRDSMQLANSLQL